MKEIVDTYCVRCGSGVGHDPERPDFCEVCWDQRRPLPREVKEAIRVLATMTKNAPSYEVTVKPFADAHQEACGVLHKLQKLGVAEAN